MDDEHPSINLNHHILENKEANLQVDTSNSFPSTPQVDKDTAILIASDALSLSKKDQRKCIMLASLADLEPITSTPNTGKKILFTKQINKYWWTNQLETGHFHWKI